MTTDFETTINKLKPFLVDYLKEKGIDPTKQFVCLSPEHKDNNPSAGVVGLGTESPRVHCFGCGGTWDLFDLVQLLDDKPGTGIEWVVETLRPLAEKYGVEIESSELTEEQLYELDTYRAYKIAASLLHTSGLESPEHKPFRDAIKKREWDAVALSEYSIGTVSSFSDFREGLKKAGFTPKFLDEIDLGRKDLFSPENIIFTWKDEKGRPIGFTARHLNYEKEKAQAEKAGKKYNGTKYNNQRTTGLRCNIFQKGRRLYGIETAIKAPMPLYIFEGQADVMTARQHGMKNCVAVAGSNLSTEHIHLLKDLSIYDIVLVLDGDETGRKKLAEILETKLAGHRDMRVRVVCLPEDEDPDSFIRKKGLDAFKELAHWSAFEWRLHQYTEEDDPTTICKQMIPLIVNETSAVVRDTLCRTLASRTGAPLKAIIEDLNILLDEKARSRSRERQQVLDKAIYELQKAPADAEQILLAAKSDLQELGRRHNNDALSSENFLSQIGRQKEVEEKISSEDTGFELGPDLAPLREWLRADWSKDVFIALGGKSNVGKTGLLCKIAYSIAVYNEDVTVIYHSIDDTIEQIIPRLVCIAVGDRQLTINQVRQPNYWTPKVSNLEDRRTAGYKSVMKLAQEGKLVVKDLNHGGSITFAETLVQFYKDQYPNRRVVYILDNFHKLSGFNQKDERVRFKLLSKAMKDMATKLHIPVISSVEYTKLPPGVKPNKSNISESVAMEYDTNFIAHLYSEFTDLPDAYSIYHTDKDWTGASIPLPRIEMLVDKNKITDCKGYLYFDFWPASSDYRSVSQTQVRADALVAKHGSTGANSLEEEGWGKK